MNATVNGLEEIAGKVSHLYYSKPTFSAGLLYVRGRDVKFSVKGYVKAGEPVTLRGRWNTHPKYGRQFEATEVVYVLPTNIDGLGQWLQWYGDGVGPVKSQTLIDEFGMDLTRLIVEDPQQVAACAGIPIEAVNRLAERWVQHAGRVAAATQFAAWGLTQAQTEAILGRFGGGAVRLIEDDPYAVMGRVDGFGWTRADELAAKVGCVGDDPRRLRGAVAAAVRERYDQGCTAVPLDAACQMAADKVGRTGDTAELVERHIGMAVDAGRIRRIDGAGEAWLATPWGYSCEAGIWKALATAREPNPQFDGDAAVVVNGYYRECGDKRLDDGQVAAVVNAATYRVSVITGSAGSGKTLVASQITKLFLDGDVEVRLCAPTGKAARRLEEVIGREATTIHRLLEYSGQDGGFTRNAKRPLFEDEWVRVGNEYGDGTHLEPRKRDKRGGVVICDEASMIDAELAYHLLTALGPNTALVLIGDPNQLPPVGPGSMLRDILENDLAPVTRLEKCHRQAGTLKQNCNAILDGKVEPWASDVEPSPWVISRKCDTAAKTVRVLEDLYSKYLPAWGYDPIKDTQIMTAKHVGDLGTKRLNLILQRLHQATLGNALDPVGEDDHERRPMLYVGDKVIHTQNNYTLNVMNGTVGIVREVSPTVVEYDDGPVIYPKANEGELSLAYCLSVHKTQGSEYPCAVVIVPKSHWFSQHRHWVYTAVTRAKSTAVIIGDDDGIRRAVDRVENDKRLTLLAVFAANEGARP